MPTKLRIEPYPLPDLLAEFEDRLPSLKLVEQLLGDCQRRDIAVTSTLIESYRALVERVTVLDQAISRRMGWAVDI